MSGPRGASPRPTEGRRTSRLRRAAAVAGVLALVAAIGVLALNLRGRDTAPEATVDAGDVRDAGRAAVPVCGYPDLDHISHDGVDPAARHAVLRTLVADVTTAEGNRPVAIQVRDDVAYVMEFDGRSTYTVTGYDVATGGRRASVPIPLAWEEGNESFSTEHLEIGDDGSFYILDTLQGRRDLIRVAPDGEPVWRTELPGGSQTTGSVLDLYGLVLWTDLEDEPLIGVHEGDRFHLVTTDGEYAGVAEGFPGTLVTQLPDGAVVLEDEDEDESGGTVRRSLVVAGSDGDRRVSLGSVVAADRRRASQQPHWPYGTTGVAPGPGGDGLLIARDHTGIEWVGSDGVRKGIWLDSRVDPDHHLALHTGSDLRLADGTYYFLSEGRAGVALTAVPEEAMLYLLEAPVRYNARLDGHLAQLGVGAGLVTDAVDNYFPAGRGPEVRATFDESWAGAGYRLRYEVRGDPRVHDPVATQPVVVDLPTGGDLRLDLPPARPGVYEVDAALVDTETGRAVSGTCLRYAVGAPGGAGDLSRLAPPPERAGGDPVRGVQLVNALAIGTYRWDLDFGAIVPDPRARPDAAALRWDSLPGTAAEGTEATDEHFARLAQAAALAQESGTALVLQLASGEDAERTAVENGTWEGWARVIVAEVHRYLPGTVYWEPWDEPDAAGFSGDRYVRLIGAPFARAARAADPDARIIGGNTGAIEPHWWAAAVAAGGCDAMDVAGVHLRTELNRSREEEGLTGAEGSLADLTRALAPCGEIPVWDTESGWWSDGVVNFWGQGHDVARALLWNRVQGVAEWVYAAEGGFGGITASTALLQTGHHLKPGGGAFAATARLIDGRPAQMVDTGIPYLHGVRLGAVNASEGVADPGHDVLALWTDDLSTEVLVTASAAGSGLRVIDHYGAATERTIPDEGLVLPVTGAPVFLAAPPEAGIEVRAVEPFGQDVLLGAQVSASSTAPDADPQIVTSGTANVTTPWRSGSLPGGGMDTAPWLQVDLGAPQEINRIAVASPGIRCCTTGLRDYTVSVRDESGSWQRVAQRRDQLFDRVTLFSFPAVTATAVRVDIPMTVERGVPVLGVNYTGAVGGAHPWTVPLTSTSEGIAAVSGVAAWSPGP